MNNSGRFSWLAFTAVQTVTASRILLAAGAILTAHSENPHGAATLVTLGIVTDGVDGVLARRLRVQTEFGGLFDYFADYLCYIVAPWLLSQFFIGPVTLVGTLITSLPLLTGAIRYARNGNLIRTESFEQSGFPGLLTVFYSLFVVCLLFLEVSADGGLRVPIIVAIAFLSCMMVAPVRYPKLTKFKFVFAVVYITLTIMPFVLTRFLSMIALLLVFGYSLLSPLLMVQSRRTRWL